MIRMLFQGKNMPSDTKPAASGPNSDLQQKLLFLLRAGFWDLLKMFEGEAVDYSMTKTKTETDDLGTEMAHMIAVVCLGYAGLFWGFIEFDNSFQRCRRARKLMDESEKEIRKMRGSEFRLHKLDAWEKKRESAAACLKKHKIMGKLVKMFPRAS